MGIVYGRGFVDMGKENTPFVVNFSFDLCLWSAMPTVDGLQANLNI